MKNSDLDSLNKKYKDPPKVYIVYCPVHGLSKHLNPFDSGCCLIAVNGLPCKKKYIIFI